MTDATLEDAETLLLRPLTVEGSIGCGPRPFQPSLQFKSESSILGVSTVSCTQGYQQLRSGILLRDMSTELEQSLTTALRDIQSCIGHADTDAMATAKLLKATTSVDKGFCVPRSDGSHDFHKVDTYRLPSHVGWTLIEPSYIESVNRSMEE